MVQRKSQEEDPFQSKLQAISFGYLRDENLPTYALSVVEYKNHDIKKKHQNNTNKTNQFLHTLKSLYKSKSLLAILGALLIGVLL